jgi:hypothetical protein
MVVEREDVALWRGNPTLEGKEERKRRGAFVCNYICALMERSCRCFFVPPSPRNFP